MNEQLLHSVSLNDRKQLVMEGVKHVDSFDEKEITLETNLGRVVLKGESLHITQLNLDTGNLAAEGFFNSIQYMEGKSKGKGVLGRILK